jgi:hypothetical protein
VIAAVLVLPFARIYDMATFRSSGIAGAKSASGIRGPFFISQDQL